MYLNTDGLATFNAGGILEIDFGFFVGQGLLSAYGGVVLSDTATLVPLSRGICRSRWRYPDQQRFSDAQNHHARFRACQKAAASPWPTGR